MRRISLFLVAASTTLAILIALAAAIALIRLAGAGEEAADFVFGQEQAATPTPPSAAFAEWEVSGMVQQWVAARGNFPKDARWVRCNYATYNFQNHLWRVDCDFFFAETSTEPLATKTYLFDDRTGELRP